MENNTSVTFFELTRENEWSSAIDIANLIVDNQGRNIPLPTCQSKDLTHEEVVGWASNIVGNVEDVYGTLRGKDSPVSSPDWIGEYAKHARAHKQMIPYGFMTGLLMLENTDGWADRTEDQRNASDKRVQIVARFVDTRCLLEVCNEFAPKYLDDQNRIDSIMDRVGLYEALCCNVCYSTTQSYAYLRSEIIIRSFEDVSLNEWKPSHVPTIYRSKN